MTEVPDHAMNITNVNIFKRIGSGALKTGLLKSKNVIFWIKEFTKIDKKKNPNNVVKINIKNKLIKP